MTENELQQVFFLRKEIKMWEDKLAELTEIRSPAMNAAGRSGVSSPVVSLAEQRDKIRTIIEGKKTELAMQEIAITEYIMSVDDSFMRQIMYKRHVQLMSWTAIAVSIGGNNTADGVRMAHKRFLSSKK